MGMSPWDTTQVSWAKAPESMTSLPKENGTILGGSKTFKIQVFKTENIQCLPTNQNLPLTTKSAE